ncbi:hypothetical protein Cni_G27612 [Canna indica]|uniref:CRIB domain-containing protein n=1 Tax=Canna indica TaxID=4628 RepID=A0AAQ3L214_9LILI|nr:hypothetical protein Cni_G27612 [Canna indica]
MAIKMKGLLKGIKYISHIFAHKEHHEMEIGYPTDVKHVAHVGFDNIYGTSPSWMNDYKTSPDFTSGSFTTFGSRETSWASQDFEQRDHLQPAVAHAYHPCPDLPKAPKKTTDKSKKPNSKVKSPPSSARSSRSSASRDSYSTAFEDMRSEFRLV